MVVPRRRDSTTLNVSLRIKASYSVLITELLGTQRLHPTELVVDLNYPVEVSWLPVMTAKRTVTGTCDFVKVPLRVPLHTALVDGSNLTKANNKNAYSRLQVCSSVVTHVFWHV